MCLGHNEPMTTCLRRLIVALVLLAPGLLPAPTVAQEPIETGPSEDDGSEVVLSSTSDPDPPPAGEAPEAEASAETPATNPCEINSQSDEPWLDQMRREVFETICDSARWFDGFFGDRRFDEEARRTHGRALLRFVYDEYDDVEVDARLRVRVDLPNLDDRVNAFFGREDETAFVTSNDDDIGLLPDFFRSEGDEEWLIGLGYRPVGNSRRRTDFDVGVDIDTPIEPFVRGRYRQYWLVGDRNLLRLQETLYWRNQHGFGTSTRLDLERPLGRRFLGRWANRVTYDEATEGIDWGTGITLYQAIGPDQALALFLGADGETDKEVPVEEYGTRLTYRRRMLREWFFGELIGGVTWPRQHLEETREASWHFGFGFEIQFSGSDLGVGTGPAEP